MMREEEESERRREVDGGKEGTCFSLQESLIQEPGPLRDIWIFFGLDAVDRGWALSDFLVCLAVCEDAACLARRHGPLVTL